MGRDLNGKPILIAGASSGIGAATAIACAQAGMPVALGARRRDKLDAVADQCRATGVAAVAIECDVTKPDACDRFVAGAESRLGPIYAAFANAGYGAEAAATDMTDDDIRAMFETNYFGSLNILRPAVAGMLERRVGHALLCSSCLGVFPTPYYGVYSATKAAQHHLGRAMDVELRPNGIRVSTVHPVGTKTDFFDTMQSHGSTRIMGSSDAFMQPASKVADAIVRCLRRPKPEIWTSPVARFGMIMAGLTPRLTNAATSRVVRSRLKRASFKPVNPKP